MSKKLTYPEYKRIVEEQGQALLDTLAYAATGNLDVEIEIPEGIEIMSDLAVGFSYLVEDVKELLREQRQIQVELERRVTERTRELETALAELRTVQQRYIREQWQSYTKETVDEETAVPALWSPTVAETIQSQKPISHSNGDHVLTFPIQYVGETIGVLGFGSDANEPWEEEDITAVSAVVEQLGLALENLRLSEQTQAALSETERQARNLAVINEVAQAVSQQIDPVTLLGTVYEQILQVMAADSFMVALYDRGQDLMEFPVIYDEGRVYREPPTAPSPTSNFYRVVETGEPVLINRTPEEVAERTKQANKSGMIGNHQKVSASLLYVPLQIGREATGALSVQSYQFNAYSEADVTMLIGIANHVAVALENARLFEQTQTALTETGTLYTVSAQLNAATTLEEVVKAAAVPALEAGAADGGLFTFELDVDGQPEWAESAAVLAPASGLSIGTRFYLPNFPLAELWLSDPTNALLIADVTQDKRVNPASQAILLQAGVHAAVIMALVVSNRWIGLITLSWTRPHTFAPADQRLYNAIAAQAATVADSLLLFNEAQQRAAQLEKLSQVETALSQADTEERILQAIINVIAPDTLSSVSLTYLNTDLSNKIASLDVVGLWMNGQFITDVLGSYQAVPLETFPIASVWLERPNELTVINNVETDARLNEAIRQQAAEQGWKASVFIPLRTSGRWQGLISFNWGEPHELSDDEQFIFEGILEPVSAVVGTRRAQIAQQQALAETEALYKATAELNVAQSYQDIITALRDHTILGQGATIVSLNYFDHPWTADSIPEQLEVLDFWSKLPPTKEFSPYYRLADFPNTPVVLRSDVPTLIENIATDPRMDEAMRKLYQKRFLAQSAALVPLVVGGQWIGYIAGMYPHPKRFPETEIRRLMALAGQAAIALQGLRLLDETRRLFSQEQKRAGELSILNEMARELTLALEVNEALDKIYQHTTQLMDANNFYIALHDAVKNEITFPIAYENGEQQRWRSRPFGNGMTEHVIRNAQGLLIEEGVDNWLQSQGIDSIGHPSQSWLGMPLQFGIEVLGVMAVQSPKPRLYNHDHFSLLEAVARQGAIAIQSARLFMAEQNRAQELTILNQMARDLTLALDEETVAEKLYEYTSRLMDTTNFYIAIYHSVADEMAFPIFVGDGKRRSLGPRKPTGIAQAILDLGEPVLVEDGVDKWLTSVGKQPINCDSYSMMGMPMKSGNQILGILNLQNPQPYIFTRNHLNLLTAIASQGTIALQNARLFQQTQQRARREQLLREIATKVRSSADVDTIMKTAVQEIGRALGRRTFVYLENPEQPVGSDQ